MAYGFETYDASGGTLISSSNRLTRLVQSNYVYLNQRSSTTIYVPGMAPNGQWAVLSFQPLVVTIGNGYYTVFNAAYDWAADQTLLAFQY